MGIFFARMVEWVYTPILGIGAERFGGSNPSTSTLGLMMELGYMRDLKSLAARIESSNLSRVTMVERNAGVLICLEINSVFQYIFSILYYEI